MDMNLSKLWERVEDKGASVLQSRGSQTVGHDLVTEQQMDGTGYPRGWMSCGTLVGRVPPNHGP